MELVRNILFVMLGSGLGGALRYLAGRLVTGPSGSMFPWSTLLVNLTGCLLIGIFYGAISRGFTLSAHMRLFLTVGLCGGFTTFSTFAHENYLLFNQGGHFAMLLLYAAVSFIGGLLMVWLGYLATRVVC